MVELFLNVKTLYICLVFKYKVFIFANMTSN